jgi:hypothetical protein
MPMPTFPFARLGAFRAELHACFTRRADALFELGDALLCTPTPVPSLPHLSLEPVHQRGWGHWRVGASQQGMRRSRSGLAFSLLGR